jgi:hypothetical protein
VTVNGLRRLGVMGDRRGGVTRGRRSRVGWHCGPGQSRAGAGLGQLGIAGNEMSAGATSWVGGRRGRGGITEEVAVAAAKNILQNEGVGRQTGKKRTA